MVKPRSRVSGVVVSGPLEPFADAFRLELTIRGYMPRSVVPQLRQVGRLSRWLQGQGLTAEQLDEVRVEAFLAVQREGGRHRSEWSRPGLRCLLEVLGELGVAGVCAPVLPGTDTEALLGCFERYLLDERGLAVGTVAGYVAHARRFLSGLSVQELHDLDAGEVTAAVLREVDRGVSVSAAQYFVAGLRAFLRYCFMEGRVGTDLAGAALAVTGRRRSPLPQGISPGQARALLDSCDRRTALGRRDHAIILSLLRLGLRRGELAAVTLDDLDWRAGEVVIHGKGGRVDRLPLPADVGAAIACYLGRGRPSSSHRQLFLQGRAPFTPIDPGTVSSTVRRACRRAGIASIGAHRLRHTMACQMVDAGVPLIQIGQVLRHQSLQSTAIYARVDVEQLRAAGGTVADNRSAAMNTPSSTQSSTLGSTLGAQVADYLRLRRALGFKLERAGLLLPQLVAYLEAAGATTVTSDLAIAWARLPERAQPNHLAQRLAVARGFARYLQTIDPATQVPPSGVFPTRRSRPTPYLWSAGDIDRMLKATRALWPPLRAATHYALFGLIAVSGMRLGETIALHRDDVALDNGAITIRQAKFDRSRLVPLHPSTSDALRSYAAERDQLCPRPRSTAFFLSSVGTTLTRTGVDKTFRQITTSIGVRTATTHPRVHDLRHSFAVATLIRWHRAGMNVEEHIAVLSTYLGHVAPADTYWYLSAAPELMALAAERLDQRFGAPR